MSGVKTSESLLGRFSHRFADAVARRVCSAVGVISAFVAKALLWLIAEITNLVFFQRFSPEMETLQHHHLGRVGHRRAGGRRAHHRIDGALRLGENPRPRNSGSARSDSPRRQFDSAESGDAQANFVGDFHRHRRAVRRGRSDHHDGRRVRFDPRAVVSSHRGRTQNAARGRRGRRNVGGFCCADRRDLLAVELLLFEWRPRSFIPVVVASVVAWLCRIPLLGAGPIFPITPHAQLGLWPIVAGVRHRDRRRVSAPVCSPRWFIFSKTLLRSCRFTGCGGRRSARSSSASAAGSIRACSASAMN